MGIGVNDKAIIQGTCYICLSQEHMDHIHHVFQGTFIKTAALAPFSGFVCTKKATRAQMMPLDGHTGK